MLQFKEFYEIMYCFPEENPGDLSVNPGRSSVRRLSQRRVTKKRTTLRSSLRELPSKLIEIPPSMD